MISRISLSEKSSSLKKSICCNISKSAFALIFVAAFIQMETWLKISLIVFGFVLFLAGCFYALRIEQVAGYYECKHCKHRYVPTYKAVNMAMHMGRTRYMRCPKCGTMSWQKKMVSKE